MQREAYPSDLNDEEWKLLKTLLKKGHFAENLTRYHTILNLYDPRFSGHIEFFQRSHLCISIFPVVHSSSYSSGGIQPASFFSRCSKRACF